MLRLIFVYCSNYTQLKDFSLMDRNAGPNLNNDSIFSNPFQSFYPRFNRQANYKVGTRKNLIQYCVLVFSSSQQMQCTQECASKVK